jgi:hypothetical protein
MRLIWKSSPSPRLLNTVVPEVVESKVEIPTAKTALKGASVFSGNGRAIFVGIVAGAGILSILGLTYTRYQEQKRQREAVARGAAITMPSTPRTESPVPPASILISHIHVTAISLGEPRLAILNGQQVMEGESITISLPGQLTTVRLRVAKIVDGRVDLSDGSQVIPALLETSRGPIRKP